MKNEKDDFLDKFDKMLKTGEIMRFKDVKRYYGKFTGKMVKPIDDQDFKQFKKGDMVIVFNAKEYFKYRKGFDLLIGDINDTKITLKKKIDKI